MTADELIKRYGSARAVLRMCEDRPAEVLDDLRGRLLWDESRLSVGHRYTDDMGDVHIYTDMGQLVNIGNGATGVVAWPLEVV